MTTPAPVMPTRRRTVGGREHIDRDYPRNGAIWWGRNTREHGHEFFLGLANADDSASLRIPHEDRERVATQLERFARSLRGRRK